MGFFKVERLPVRGCRQPTAKPATVERRPDARVRPSSLLSAQAVQIPLQFRGSLCGKVGEAARACFSPKGAFPPSTAFGIALIHPVPLRLAEALLELGPARLAALRDQVLVGPIEIRIVLHDRAIETRALINRGGRVARIT